jgi:hypothetical protein
MKHFLSAGLLLICLGTQVFAVPKGPEIDLRDNKLSINAEAIPLGRLLRLLDLATGMQSKVPPDLANRNVSVKFSGLSLEDGVRKIFQGQPLDYVVVEGQGVIVTAASQTTAGPESAPVYNANGAPPPGQFQPQPTDLPFNQEMPPAGGVAQPGFAVPQPGQPGQPGAPGQQPAMIQTPFGPIVNPRAGQPVQPGAPAQAPQQNPLFPGSMPQQQPSSGVVGAQQAAPVPFGGPGAFGTPQANPNNSNLFGSPTIFTAPNGTQPR